MDVLSSRMLLHPVDLVRSQTFYRDVIGLAVAREFGAPDLPGIVFFMGSGYLEVSGRSTQQPSSGVAIWMQVRDVRAEHERIVAAGGTSTREPRLELWGLTEAWIADPDGIPIVLVEVPPDHPIRRDGRQLDIPASTLAAPDVTAPDVTASDALSTDQ
jgi:predicted enzyme related to lactoylglutathione lyase